ncbi:DNA-3-methyladenine glycosylase I [Parvularcula marina]|uniref:DNA-3-methyladenine glycosylase I n=1 Tax=Parvularcula marina TaxID=2292771 RepID=UPI003518A6BC
MKNRCDWVAEGDVLYESYHDTEWGVPNHDSKSLWGKLILDGFQAGLSWRTILHKRENFLDAFDGLDPEKVARYTDKRVEKLLGNAGIIRHRGKIEGAITNAKLWCEMTENGEDFSAYLWSYFDGAPITNKWKMISQVPATSPQGDALSKDLKKRGFKFCGPTIVYAFAQAVGMVNDHLVTCPRHREVATLSGV